MASSGVVLLFTSPHRAEPERGRSFPSSRRGLHDPYAAVGGELAALVIGLVIFQCVPHDELHLCGSLLLTAT